MVKFPSQSKLQYETPALGDDAWASAGYLCLPKDLSILNRRGYQSTTRKGVPLVYRCAVTLSQHTLTGRASARDSAGDSSASEETDTETLPAFDNTTLLKFDGCQNNWVMRNAAVKWHALRQVMWKGASITKSQLGSYTDAIRYNLDSASQSWNTPVDGDGAAFTGGTWDVSLFVSEPDPEFQLKLIGTGNDEDAAINTSVINMAYSYLSSRSHVPEDTNLESTETPAVNSIMKQMMNFDGVDRTEQSYIETDVKGQGDNPPYDIFASADTNHDITEPVELGRCIAGPGNGIGTMIIDIPFGLARVQARHSGSQDQTVVDPVAYSVEVLDIYEMQG